MFQNAEIVHLSYTSIILKKSEQLFKKYHLMIDVFNFGISNVFFVLLGFFAARARGKVRLKSNLVLLD